ncbi:hypothetical protein P153DRAFT_362332 [Dothidotthia symphoricarpi CBS 119687]|uniref:Frequency clock protein n=1 Tax=Dothidotthia symphoricarpi CBS 119687 TaxID=1392245 RepID=A0A6A6AUG4_9PLEO|nr:uncharacterized protein P153DRAFT_362332 [Dothidotthia symphoricarpi CBS 119687]KAF2134574.1 hypothetical protein P153DRAFT_362332 [Dothidotthia symphoricarpi CBS 119687]
MNDPPGKVSVAGSTQHPRRRPAHQSVSLRHGPPAASYCNLRTTLDQQLSTLSSTDGPASDRANPPSSISSISPQLLTNQHSSGESSDAGKWFEKTNNDARQSSALYVNNDPPFFLRNSSSSESPPNGLESHDARMYSSMPYRPGLVHFGTDGSSTEDFRGVIDDLTVANKKLKQKLKKYEKLYDDHLEEDKLFEVRFHGLSDHKKKELEETLRKFAAGLDDDADKEYPHISRVPTLEHQRTAESGYASLTASCQNSSAPSNQTLNTTEHDRKMTKSAYGRQQQSIQSYLHDIPLGLLPRYDTTMSEKSKKQLVVRRLEQIFAGKRSMSGNHPQPMQQEEVAQSAATADRREREATGRGSRPEGLREAQFMAEEEGDIPIQADTLQKFHPNLHVSEQDFAGSGSSPDQRPTRPLDLDPYRAQFPLENMDYFRHLGFTPPDMASGEVPEEGHGWLYLNLLINMAQLHTLHVTPDFVKDAVTDYSSHLELSPDGRKIRWKGDYDITTQSSDGSSERYSGNSPPDHVPGFDSPLKQIRTGNSGASSGLPSNAEQHARQVARAKRANERNKLAYTPLFFHKEDSDDEDDFYNPSLLQPPQPGNPSGMGSSAMNSSSSRRRRDDGPIIFYNRARFCTDLTGDRLGASLTSPGLYKAMVSQPLGAPSSSHSPENCLSDSIESRGPLDVEPMDVDSRDGSRTMYSEGSFGFSLDSLSYGSGNGNDSPDAMNFEASGLGGVHPDDNFTIRVRRSQTQTSTLGSVARCKSNFYPKKILDALKMQLSAKDMKASFTSSPQRVIREQILSASRKSLPSSALPPASFLPFDSAYSETIDSDYDSDASSEVGSDSSDGLDTALQLPNVYIASGRSRADNVTEEGSDEESEYSDDSDDGSIDLLATARQLDPNTIRASEREYDAAIADRLAEEIVAGSSAATAAGGSGFNSPVDLTAAGEVYDVSVGNKRQSESLSPRAKLKRSRASDSTGAALKMQKTE